MSLSTYFLKYGRHVGQLRRRRRCGRAYAPTSNTASHDNHEKINSWFFFSFYMNMRLRLAAHRAAEAPLKPKKAIKNGPNFAFFGKNFGLRPNIVPLNNDSCCPNCCHLKSAVFDFLIFQKLKTLSREIKLLAQIILT